MGGFDIQGGDYDDGFVQSSSQPQYGNNPNINNEYNNQYYQQGNSGFINNENNYNFQPNSAVDESTTEHSYQENYQKMYGNSDNDNQETYGYSFNSGTNNYHLYSESDTTEYNNMVIVRNKVKHNKPLIIGIGLVIAYIVFLIIGLLGTTYKENEYGEKQAVVANMDNRKVREDYDTLKVYYLDMKEIMNLSATYEHDMELGNSTYFTIATNYEDILTTIDARITKVRSLNIDTRYTALKTQEAETYNYIALYCQKMQTALMNDDYQSYVEATSWRDTALVSLENVRANLVAMGENDAKLYNDKDLEIVEENVQTSNDAFKQDGDISTGVYGQKDDDTLIQVPSSSQGGLGQGRNGNKSEPVTTDDTSNENVTTNQNTQEIPDDTSIDDGNISIENPYK